MSFFNFSLPSKAEVTGEDPSYTEILGKKGKQFLTDYALLNILHVSAVACQRDDLKQAFHDAQQDIQDWQAWEASIVETYLQSKVKTRELPSDSDLDSILKRNSYRAKVAQVYREHGTWFSDISIDDSKKDFKDQEPETTEATIVEYVTGLLPASFSQLEVVLQPVVRALVDDGPQKRSYMYTFIAHDIDTRTQRVQSTVWELDVDIQTDSGGGKVGASVQHALRSRNFNHEIWRKQGGKKQHDIDAGREISRKYTLRIATKPKDT
jgi:hypothetical protein